jgi:hypothetical protein
MNGSLVETGLDLVECPEMHRTQVNFSTDKVAQQNARNHRLGQTKDVRRIWSFYKNTIQERAVYLMADKLNAISMFDGEVAEGLAAMGAKNDSFLADLQRSVANDEVLNPPKNMRIITPMDFVSPVPGSAAETLVLDAKVAAEINREAEKRVYKEYLATKGKEPLPAGRYAVRHQMGVLYVRNGTAEGSVSWLGGENLSGPDNLIPIVKLAGLAKRPTSKAWSTDVEWTP